MAAEKAPVMAIPNWIRSTTRTPHRPARAAKVTLMILQMMRVLAMGQPRMTLAILAAARLTEAMITQLKKSPR